MKNIKYIIFSLFIIFGSFNIVKADCTKEELSKLKEEAGKIKVTYKHLGEVTLDDGSKVYNQFLVTVKNLPKDARGVFYPTLGSDYKEIDNGFQIKLITGTWYLAIYFNKCDYSEDITVELPRFNTYSLDPACEGIDTDEFALCRKYFDYEFSKETFERKLLEYKKQKATEDKNKKTTIKEEKNILKLINKFKIYIILTLLLILIILLIILLIKKKKIKKVINTN